MNPFVAMDEPVTELRIHCAHCGRPVTLQLTFGDGNWWADPEKSDDSGTLARWTCPHCHEKNKAGFPGRLTGILKGHV